MRVARCARAARIFPTLLIAAARELRDRYLEQVNESPLALTAAGGKYDVARALVAPTAGPAQFHPPVLLLAG